MSLKFKAGDLVRQVMKPIEGVVKAAQVVDDELHHLVEWVTEEGHATSKWFHEKHIELHPEQPVAEVPQVAEVQTISAADVGDAAQVLAQ